MKQTLAQVIANAVHTATAPLLRKVDELERRIASLPNENQPVLRGIIADVSYARGTFAHHDGGLIRAFRDTDKLRPDLSLQECGWDVIVDGIAEAPSFDLSNGGQLLVAKTRMTSGKAWMRVLKVDLPRYRGPWRQSDGMTCYRNEIVSFQGSAWICEVDKTTEGPPGSGWRLMVKRGRDTHRNAEGPVRLERRTRSVRLKEPR